MFRLSARRDHCYFKCAIFHFAWHTIVSLLSLSYWDQIVAIMVAVLLLLAVKFLGHIWLSPKVIVCDMYAIFGCLKELIDGSSRMHKYVLSGEPSIFRTGVVMVVGWHCRKRIIMIEKCYVTLFFLLFLLLSINLYAQFSTLKYPVVTTVWFEIPYLIFL